MYLISLSLLLLAPWPALAGPSGGVRALQWHHNKRDSHLPYPLSYSAASCSRASTNVFKDHLLVPQQTLPEPFLTNGRLTNGAPSVISARAQRPTCREIGSFTFTPVGERMFSIQRIRLQPGNTYVLSVAANNMISYLSAFSVGMDPPHRHRAVEVSPSQNVGTLTLSVDEPSEVFFLIVFRWQFTSGEIALFSFGVGVDG